MLSKQNKSKLKDIWNILKYLAIKTYTLKELIV